MENETTPDPAVETFATAFIVMKSHDGNWRVTSDLGTPFAISESPSRGDVRIGCQEIARIIDQQDLAGLVLEVIEQNSMTDSQRISASMRDAVSRRNSTE
ncbi:hypothetical protein UFOVP225_91 [uncultured Caudovirales phage]|uniref:Uncharacterized protein n=1 Tax=uncultured Caudovirales phage TaxID=2100421 RepID=A0A6J7WS25_9CAUD|nr:hypothetical protein UFOVP113_104 [uncultured Caudovirales phage]CAB5219585.1 hypothetical protein UFOVP225_91 [uncultured Caudovirales phage]